MYKYKPIKQAQPGDVVEATYSSLGGFTAGNLYIVAEPDPDYDGICIKLDDHNRTINGMPSGNFKLLDTLPGTEAKVGDQVILVDDSSSFYSSYGVGFIGEIAALANQNDNHSDQFSGKVIKGSPRPKFACNKRNDFRVLQKAKPQLLNPKEGENDRGWYVCTPDGKQYLTQTNTLANSCGNGWFKTEQEALEARAKFLGEELPNKPENTSTISDPKFESGTKVRYTEEAKQKLAARYLDDGDFVVTSNELIADASTENERYIVTTESGQRSNQCWFEAVTEPCSDESGHIQTQEQPMEEDFSFGIYQLKTPPPSNYGAEYVMGINLSSPLTVAEALGRYLSAKEAEKQHKQQGNTMSDIKLIIDGKTVELGAKAEKRVKSAFESKDKVIATFYDKKSGALANIADHNSVKTFKSEKKAKAYFGALDMPHKYKMVLSREISVVATDLPLVETESN